MGQQVSKRPIRKKNWKQQARIQGLYEMYTESIKLTKLIKNQSILGSSSIQQKQNGVNKNKQNYNKKQHSYKKNSEQESKFLEQLLCSFQMRNQFSWSQEIPQLFKKYFNDGFRDKWQESKQFFYELLLENVGVNVDRNGLQQKNKQFSFEQHFHKIIKQRNSVDIKSSFLLNDEQIDRRKQQQIVEVQSQRMTLQQEINFINESIIDAETLQYQEKIVIMGQNRGQFKQRVVVDDDDNNDGIIIIGEVLQSTVSKKSEYNNNNNNNNNSNNNSKRNSGSNNIKENANDDDEYFLPLITKRRNNNNNNKQKGGGKIDKNDNMSNRRLAQRISQQSEVSEQHEIEMSHFPSQVKYSRLRLETSSVILPSTIFYERMNFSAKVETDQSLKIYRQLSNTIQQTINSCNLISCPLKHFLLYFQYKTSKKKINQLDHSQSSQKLNSVKDINSSTVTFNQSSNDNNKHNDKHHSDSMKMKNMDLLNKHSESIFLMQNQSPIKSLSIQQASSNIKQFGSNIKSQIMHQQLFNILTSVSQKSEIIRQKREFNTNYLLKQVKQFTQAYTEFLYRYLNFDKIQTTDLSTFINLDTIYGIVLRNIWNIVNWIADRGYEWEEYALVEIVDGENPCFQAFTEEEVVERPSLIIKKYASFCNKDIKKIKVDPVKLCRAYTALLKLRNQVFPQKYLKKIIIFYRQATKCCQGADDLMTLYEFLLKNCIMNNLAGEMHIFRMKNIIDRLIPIESSAIDGAGEIVYAWTTWNIILEVFNIKLKQYKKVLLARDNKKTAILPLNRANTEKKSSSDQKQQKNKQTTKRSSSSNDNKKISGQNPERKSELKRQFTLTQCNIRK